MLCDQLRFRALLTTIFQIMGCFFGCFRIKDADQSKTHLVVDTAPSRSKEPLVSRNRLSSLLSLEEQSSPSKKGKEDALQSSGANIGSNADNKELWAEANFLKSCGTLLQTPIEIRKASAKLKVPPQDSNDDSSSSKLYFCPPGSSSKKSDIDGETEQTLVSNVRSNEELDRNSVEENSNSLQQKSKSSPTSEGQKFSVKKCMASTQESGHENVNAAVGIPGPCGDGCTLPAATPELPVAAMQCRKCVQFECDNENAQTGSKRLPDPTPLKLTDEMQTPCSVYPAKLENFTCGKNARIRSQYVYPVLNPVENSSQWKALKKNFDGHQLGPDESFEKCRCELAKTPLRSNLKDSTDDLGQNHPNQVPVDASLASWLKPVSSNEKRFQNLSVSSVKSSSGKGPVDDRPILGTVAAHWNDDEPSRISPKWWDGNGIPNSTNKYKEDQKVSWHATPFEERLEKALSDERLFPQRSIISGRPIDFDESEESDTAASKFHTPHILESTVQS